MKLILHFQLLHLVKLSYWHPFHKFAKSNLIIVMRFTKLPTTHCQVANSMSPMPHYQLVKSIELPKMLWNVRSCPILLEMCFLRGQILPQKVRQPNFHTLPKGSRLCLFLLLLFYFVSFMRAHPIFIHKIPSTKIHNKIIC